MSGHDQPKRPVTVLRNPHRVYTAGRIGLAAGSFAGGVTGALGLLTATGIAMHNLLTLSPDYVIEKYPTYNRIVVRYKKKKK